MFRASCACSDFLTASVTYSSAPVYFPFPQRPHLPPAEPQFPTIYQPETSFPSQVLHSPLLSLSSHFLPSGTCCTVVSILGSSLLSLAGTFLRPSSPSKWWSLGLTLFFMMITNDDHCSCSLEVFLGILCYSEGFAHCLDEWPVLHSSWTVSPTTQYSSVSMILPLRILTPTAA